MGLSQSREEKNRKRYPKKREKKSSTAEKITLKRNPSIKQRVNKSKSYDEFGSGINLIQKDDDDKQKPEQKRNKQKTETKK